MREYWKKLKIKQKLTLQFVLLTALTMGGALALVYIVFKGYSQTEFYDRLKERAQITAVIQFEKDELSKKEFEQYEYSFDEIVPDETIFIFDENEELTYQSHPVLNKEELLSFYRNILKDKPATIKGKINNKLFAGLSYTDNQGTFYIFVQGIDRYGNTKLQNFSYLIVLVLLLVLALTFILGRYFSNKALEAMNKVVLDANTINSSNLHMRIYVPNNDDEIGELAKTFNAMLGRLEKSFKQQRDFISNASHELRTPLAILTSRIQTLISKPRNIDEYKEALADLQTDAQALNHLVTDLLQLAQVDSPQVMAERKPIRLDELFLEAFSVSQERFPSLQGFINFENLPENDEQLIVTGNKKLLLSAFVNIMANAFKYGEGKPVHCTFQFNEGRRICIIEDGGIGIDEQEMAHIFEPFFRSHNARNKTSGHGIGLPLAHQVLQLHGFKISVSSALGKGSKFEISI